MIGVFFELFWLDTFPAGTYIPPQQTFAAFFCIIVADQLALSAPTTILPLLLLVLPLTSLMNQLEVWFRKRENLNYKKIILQVKNKGVPFRPETLVQGSILKTAGLNALACALCLGASLPAMGLILNVWPQTLPGLTWGHLLTGALAAGFLSLRSKRVYGFAICGVVCLAILLLFQ